MKKLTFSEMKTNLRKSLADEARDKFDNLTVEEQNSLVVKLFIKTAANGPVCEETCDEVEKYATKEQAKKLYEVIAHRVLARGEYYAWEKELVGEAYTD